MYSQTRPFMSNIWLQSMQWGLNGGCTAQDSVRDAAEIEVAIETMGREPGWRLMVLPEPLFPVHQKLIVELVARYKLPTVYPFRRFTVGGGLMSYSVDVVDLYGRAAGYVDRILRGSVAAEMPVQQPTKYELVINLKTAKALASKLPPTGWRAPTK